MALFGGVRYGMGAESHLQITEEAFGQGSARRGVAWRGKVGFGRARSGKARLGKASRGMAWERSLTTTNH